MRLGVTYSPLNRLTVKIRRIIGFVMFVFLFQFHIQFQRWDQNLFRLFTRLVHMRFHHLLVPFLVIIWTQFVMVKCQFANYLLSISSGLIFHHQTSNNNNIKDHHHAGSIAKTVGVLIQHHRSFSSLRRWIDSAANSFIHRFLPVLVLEIRGGSTIAKDPCRKNG